MNNILILIVSCTMHIHNRLFSINVDVAEDICSATSTFTPIQKKRTKKKVFLYIKFFFWLV